MMKLFSREKKPGRGALTQLRSEEGQPFSVFSQYLPMGQGETLLYRAIREAVPVVDAAILKIIRLAGGVRPVCPREGETRALEEFFLQVPVGYGQVGVEAYLEAFWDSLLTSGRAVGEMVIEPENGALTALVCGDVTKIEVKAGTSPLDYELRVLRPEGGSRAIANPELVFFTPYHPEPGSPLGVSLLRGMPFLTKILLDIFHAVGKNWERCGRVRYAVTYRPEGDALERHAAQERVGQMAEAWADAMRESAGGRVKDFVAVGNVDIRAIGADNQVLDSSVPVRQIMEQLIARTGIPPFLLGLNWSSTERMSSQQADIMTSELTALRRSVTPMLTRIMRMWQSLHGCMPDAWVEWDVINLQDAVEEARAELYRAQAEKLRLDLK